MSRFSIFRRQHGFSVADLMAALTIIGVTMMVIIPKFATPAGSMDAAQLAREADAKIDKRFQAAINAAAERWYIEYNSWPASDLSDMAESRLHLPHGIPVNPLTGKRYTLNAETHRAE